MEKDIYMLLDNNSRNVLSILEIISEEDRWYSIIELSTKLNVVERTTQRYIHQLSDMIDEYNQTQTECIVLHYEKYKGIYLEIENGSNYNHFKNFILEQDETLHILKEIFFEEFQSVTRYSLEFFVSESKIRKSLKKIKHFLEIYNLSLSNISFQLAGDEKQIRLVSYVLSWVCFKGSEWPFDSINEMKVYESIDNFSETFEIPMSETQRKQMAYLLAVNLMRFRKNHMVLIEPEWKDYVNIEMLMERFPALKEFVLKYNIHAKSELYFYALLIQIKVKMYESLNLKQAIFMHHQQQQSDVFVVTKVFLTDFHHQLVEIPQRNYERFFITSFCAHLFCKLFKQICVDVDGHYVYKTEQDHCVGLCTKLDQFIDDMYTKTGNDIFREDRFLMQKYLILFSSIQPLTYFEPPINILVETDLPFLLKQNMLNSIQVRYQNKFNLIFLTDSHLGQADIVVTNIPNIVTNKQHSPYDIHYFDYPIRTRDIIELDKRIYSIHEEKSQTY